MLLRPLIIIFLVSLIPIDSLAQSESTRYSFKYEGHTLTGVINSPIHEEPKGMVIVLQGSGCYSTIEVDLFRDVRERFVQSGYSTFMWDKMGCGLSEGTYDYNRTIASSADGVMVAIDALKASKIKGSDHIGIWGLSRGGWIAPLVITGYPDIEFWVSVSGVDDKETFNYLFEENLRINGVPEDSIRILVNELKAGVKHAHSGGSYEDYFKVAPNLPENTFLRRFNGREISKEGYEAYQKEFMKEKLDPETGLQIIVADFDETLSKIDIPVLALFGDLDKHVDWKKTRALYEQTLAKNTDLTVKVFPGCNHNMFKSKTGGFYEFDDNDIPRIRCEGYLESIAEWLEDQEH